MIHQARKIIHVDMDEFFAAVEKLDNPSLVGKPLLVAGDPKGRGVVSTASYEAREFGCHSAMPTSRALRLCPNAIVLPIRGWRYQEVSEQIFKVFKNFSPLIEPLSIDEAFIDATGCERLLGPAVKIAADIKKAIRDELNLTASVGVAPNKFLAKIASDLQKPDGLVVITPENIHQTLDPLSVRKLWGVGPALAKKLEKFNLHTVAELRKAGSEQLSDWLGEIGEHLWSLANGIDDRPVIPDSQAKSIGQEQTFATDTGNMDTLRGLLDGQIDHVARRLRRHGLLCKTITLKLRYGDFTTLTRSKTLETATDVTDIIRTNAHTIFAKWASKHYQALRLLGVTVSQLTTEGGQQMSLFDASKNEKSKKLDRALDDIVEKFGSTAVRRATTLPTDSKSND